MSECSTVLFSNASIVTENYEFCNQPNMINLWLFQEKTSLTFTLPFLTFHVSGKKAQDLVIRSEFIFLLKQLWLSRPFLCTGHPACGPTSGSEAYLKSASASDSCQYRSKILSVSVRLYRCFAFYYYVHLPQPVGKDKYTFVHLLKESSILFIFLF